MHEDRPSFTARWVAMGRSLGAILPDGAQLIDDAYGGRVASRPMAALLGLARWQPRLRPLLRLALRPLLSGAAAMQIRTRVIDDELDRFLAAGGRQLVLLGAGFDARAHRLAERLGDARVFEVDHPATQRLKRDRFGEARATYVAWNFERDPMRELPARLGSLGHDPKQPTFTIWEGVTIYLTEGAIESTAATVRAYSAAGSRLCFTYTDKRALASKRLRGRILAAAVRRVGEPFQFGWLPKELGDWWSARGFRVLSDVVMGEAARRMLPPVWAERAYARHRHVATVEPVV
jgi:methyltransferase (TIGR00027 family)